MYCKFLKLTNGENLIVTTDDNCLSFEGKEFLYVMDPVKLNTVKVPHNGYIVESFMMEPWIRVAKDDLLSIPTKSIIVATDVQDKAIAYYQKFISEQKELETNITTREFGDEDLIDETGEFDDFLDEILDPEEEDDDGNTRDTRVLH